MEGYTLYSQQTKSASGGVALYVKSSLNTFERTDLGTMDNDYETIWIEIQNPKSKNILCCCAYRHPSSNPARFTEHLEETFHKISNENKCIFILGDFNISIYLKMKVMKHQAIS